MMDFHDDTHDDYDEYDFDDDLLAETPEERELDRKRQEMGLCSYCQNIPERFFGEVPPGFFSPADRSFVWPHNTANGIRRAAEEGCPMCWTMARGLNDDWLDADAKENETLHLKRGIMNPESTFALFLGMDDLSYHHFQVTPDLFDDAIPLAKLNVPVDETPLMDQWITDCVQFHKKCDKQVKHFIPTRLLDLRTLQDSGDIVLVELPQDWPLHIHPVMYTALSHCWGATPNPMKTLTTNYKERSSRIPFTELPLTFQHAVIITRRLEIPYLWIDSLCILQDSASDWAREVELMGRVYGGSTCTLAAMGSRDSTGGFPLSRPTIDGFDIPFASNRVRVFVAEPNTWSGGMHGPLLERAWTFQERNLSIRTLHFSEETLLWECKTARASPELPWMEATAFDADPAPKLMCDSVREAGALTNGGRSETLSRRARWFSIAEQYSQRKLSFGKDKLPALSGMAHSFGDDNKIQGYAAGLWESDVPSALLWMVAHTSWDLRDETEALIKRPSDYRAPSWSWMCLDGSITYDSIRVEAESKYDRRPSAWNFGQFCVRQMKTAPLGKDRMGTIKSGTLEISGCLRSAIVHKRPSEVNYRTPSYFLLLGHEGNRVGALFPDIWSDIREGDIIHCVGVRSESSDSVLEMPQELYGRSASEYDDLDSWLIMGLALKKKADGKDGEFTRIGMVRWIKRNYFDKVDISQAVIL